jgi:restriction endonuclease S subunit
MNAETLLENFEVLAEAPGGISTLKKLIFELAISGRLVDQVPDEGDSQVLVDELVSTRESQLRERLLPIREVAIAGDSQPSFEIPNSWRWTRLGSICYPQAGFAFKSSEFNTIGKGLPLIRIRDISTDHTQCHYSGDYRSEFVVRNGDWLIGMDGNFNIHKWLGSDALLNQRVTRLIFLNQNISKRFIAWSLQHQVTLLMGTKSYTTVDHLSTKQINEALIPIPPIAEQVRIVAKVDELMALCDQLEQQQKQRDNLRIATRKSAIDAISTATTPEELEAAWKRIDNNWEVIADTPESVEPLRALILELAVSGRFSQGVDSWDERTLGQVTKIRTGKLDANASSPDGEYPFFTCAKSPLKISTFSYDTECVLLAGNGNFDVNYYSGKFDAYQRTYIIEAKNQDELFIPYLFRFMQGHSKKLLEQSIGGVIKYIKIGFLTDAPLLLPSYSEQKQIVSKVEELMALCDQLESELKSRSEVAEKFARSVVNAA